MPDKAHDIHGGCHCGNIRLVYSSPIPPAEIPVRSCDCSFCSKQGAYYTTHPQGRLQVRITDPDRVRRYSFATLTAEAWFCGKCGTYLLMTSQIDGRLYAALNVNVLEDFRFDRLKVPSLSLSEDPVDKRLERRRKAWIANVEIISGPESTVVS